MKPFIFVVAALLLVSCAAPPFPTVQTLDGAGWTRHLDPTHGMSVRRPAYWQLQDADRLIYGAHDGQFRLYDWEGDDTSAEAAATKFAAKFGFPGATVEALTIDGQEIRLVTPRWPGIDRGYAVMALPEPIKRAFAQRTATCVMLETTRHYQRLMAASLRFDRAPADYLEGTLDLMQRFSFKRGSLDWPALRAHARAAGGELVTVKQAQAGIEDAVRTIADRHSFLLTPRDSEDFFSPGATGLGYSAEELDNQRIVTRVYAASPAEKAGMKTGDVISQRERGSAPGGERLTLSTPGDRNETTVDLVPGDYSTALQPTYQSIAPGVAYIELPDTVAGSNYDPYRKRLAEILVQGDADGAKAWIIDVRRNSGGSHWAMIAPLAPLIGEGPFGGTIGADGEKSPYQVRGNRVLEGELYVDPDLTPPTLGRANPPVAVLAGPLSASAAEAVVLSFVAHPNARIFGAATLGVPTSNTAFELWDGAFLNLATYRGLDRLGRAWDGPIPADEAVRTQWEAFASPNDPAVARALAWLTGR